MVERPQCERCKERDAHLEEARKAFQLIASWHGWFNPSRFPISLYDIVFGYGLMFKDKELRAHLRLLIYAWSNDSAVGTLRDNDSLLAAMAGVPKRSWEKVKQNALFNFEYDNGLWVHPNLLRGMVDNARRREGRRGMSPRLRFDILERDGFCCVYCGRSAPDVELAVDHVHPVALGGSDRRENLVASCVDCNSGKADRQLGNLSDG